MAEIQRFSFASKVLTGGLPGLPWRKQKPKPYSQAKD
jgi:hypothetical protein